VTPATLPGCLLHWAAVRPNAVALREKEFGVWREINWREYADDVAAVGRMLWELGVREGDHVAILSDNRHEWLYADLAAQGIGARSVGVYQTNPPADVAYVLKHSAAKVLFCEDQEQVDKVVEVARDTPALQKVVVFDPRGTRGYEDSRLLPWDEFLAGGRALLDGQPQWFEEQIQKLSPGEAAMVVYTSGTTGSPKGALISSRNALAGADSALPLLGVSDKDIILSYLPLCHVAEKIFSLFIPLAAGCIVHFGESIETIRSDLAEVSPTVFLGVPRIWEKMHASVTLKMQDSSWLKRTLYKLCLRWGMQVASKKRRGRVGLIDHVKWFIADLLIFRPLQERLGLRRCRLPISGAAPISKDLLEWFHAIGLPITEGFGMTETSGVSHINPLSDNRLGTVGRALPITECRIEADGELLIRGDNVFVGYLHNAEATQEAIDTDGWLHTGDIAQIDDDGYLSITGRKKEIIITAGGKNLSPEKIENALKMSPYIKEVVAVGDKRKFIAALIQIDYDAVGNWASRQEITYTSFSDLVAKATVVSLIDKEIRRANEAHLARVEQVRQFRLFDKELHQDDGELTATQKVRRSAVSERYGELIETMYGGRR
jgi:long-chain acyl-CoA synthetase